MKPPIVLTEKVALVLTPTAPFSFDGTMFKPSHFPTPDIAYQQGMFWQSFRLDATTMLGLKFTNAGTVDRPEVLLEVFHEPSEPGEPGVPIADQLARIEQEVRFRFNFDCDLDAFMREIGADDLLREPLERWRGLRMSSACSLYEFLVVTTLLQNTQVRRTVRMMQNLFETCGATIAFDDKVLYGFWNPDAIHAIPEQDLRDLKMGYRAKTLKRQAAAVIDDRMEDACLRGMPRDDLKKKLLGLYGIGPATVQYVMSEVFHHYDVLDHVPPWEQKIYSRLLFDQPLVEVPLILDDLDRRYGRWKVLAIHYLFEDLFWRRRHAPVGWLEELIRL